MKLTPQLRSRATTVLLAGVLLVGAANLGAYAAGGGPLVLGSHNGTRGTTTLTNHGKGPALALHARKHSPALKVDSKRKVKHLNADRLDGRSAKSLANSLVSFALPTNNAGATVKYTFPALPPGVWQITMYINRSLKATGTKLPQMACSFTPNVDTPGQGTMLSTPGSHATLTSVTVMRTDASATLTCNAYNGTFVASALKAGSGIFFLKVDRAYSQVASRVVTTD